MIRRSILTLAAVAGLCLFGHTVHAAVIYDNGGPNQLNGNKMTQWIQTEDFICEVAQMPALPYWA